MGSISNKESCQYLLSSYPSTLKKMASLFGPPSFLSYPVKKTSHFSFFHSPPQSLRVASSLEQDAIPSETGQQKVKINPSVDGSKDRSIALSLTRRFGIGAGLSWAGFLAFSVLSDYINNELQISQNEANTRELEEQEEVVLPNGIRYYELRVGDGSSPRAGDMMVIDLKGKVEGTNQPFIDTFGCEKKPLALLRGSRPYTKGMCEGIEYVSRSMKGGGKRRVIVPPNLGFGEKGIELAYGLQIPPNATLEYIVELDNVSISLV